MRKTKIICTLGPATDDPNILKELMKSGMNVARFNFSHGTHDDHKKRLTLLKQLREELNLPIATLLDTKGPEVRIGALKNNSALLKKGQTFTLTTNDVEGDNTKVSISYKDLPRDIKKGTKLLIDDGLVAMLAKEITETDIICEVLNEGKISNQKSLNVPGVFLNMPYMSEKDKNDILFGIEHDFDFIAASFTRTAYDILEIKKILETNNRIDIQVIAKIENMQGVNNINDILKVSNGIMVARGDLGVEVDFEELPSIQKKLIVCSLKAGKKVITATQMLESMTHNPRPTRAETSDVANAVYDGTSAVMLSGETAIGTYPIETLKTMARIAETTEHDINYKKRLEQGYLENTKTVTNAISHATCTTAHDLEASAVLTVTNSGYTARMVASFRPLCPIIATTANKKVYYQLAMSWGVVPILSTSKHTTDELFDDAVSKALETGIVQNGDLVVITGGAPVGISGTTNILKVHLVGNVLVSGTGINNLSASAPACVVKNENQALQEFKDGDILVIPKTSNTIIHLLKKASGIITEQGGATSHAAIVGMTLDIPVIFGAQNATRILKSDTIVTIDSNRGLVYNGATKVL